MMEMRVSKYRHVYCNAPRFDQIFQDIRTSTAIGDQNYIKANPKYLAVSVGRCGGQLLVYPNNKPGRVPAILPTLCGHAGDVLDFDFNPFDDEMILSSSVDCTLKLWKFPEGGLTENIDTPVVTLEGHQKKVTFCEFNPVANLIAASASADRDMKIWNVEYGKPISHYHTEELSQDLHWNYDGSMLMLSCKDKKYRLYDPRADGNQAMSVFHCHDGAKGSKFAWLGEENSFVTTGFTRSSQREYKIWDIRALETPLENNTIDQASGVIMPFYDPDAHLLFLSGKGDGNIRVYEVDHNKLYPTANTQYSSTVSAKGMCLMPKRGVDVMKCEIDRLYKLTSNGNIEPLQFIIPRRCEGYQDDLYTDCYAGVPALTTQQWLEGQNAKAITVTMSPYKEKVYSTVEMEPSHEYSSIIECNTPVAEESMEVEEKAPAVEPIKEKVSLSPEPIHEVLLVPSNASDEDIPLPPPVLNSEDIPLLPPVLNSDGILPIPPPALNSNGILPIPPPVLNSDGILPIPALNSDGILPIPAPVDVEMTLKEETIERLNHIVNEIEQLKNRITELEQEVNTIRHSL